MNDKRRLFPITISFCLVVGDNIRFQDVFLGNPSLSVRCFERGRRGRRGRPKFVFQLLSVLVARAQNPTRKRSDDYSFKVLKTVQINS